MNTVKKTAPITINYVETAFTGRWDENRQVVHDQVYQTLLEGRHIPKGETVRPFVYDITLLDRASGLALVTARAQSFSDGIESEAGKLTVSAGDAITVRVRVSACRHGMMDVGDRTKTTYSYVTPENIEDWGVALFSRHGLSVSSLRLLDYQRRFVFKTKNRFGINEAYLEVAGVIESPADFARAFLTGIGRNKGYGLGLMEVVS